LCWADYGFQNSTACAYRALNNNQNIDVDLSVLLANDGQDIVKSTHEKHLLVNAWTVNDVNDRDKLIKLNVDQITGNVVW
jgi:glycerophosphoryl diester phosphodiesterase